MPWLVDGDNLLGTWPGRRRSDAERRRLAFELQRLARRLRRRILVVFDGNPPPSARFGADATFAGAGRSADEEILARLRHEADRAGWTVVTSDRPLGDQCRHLGARVERSDLFRRRVAAAATEEKPERETDVGRWLEVFGGDDARGDPAGSE